MAFLFLKSFIPFPSSTNENTKNIQSLNQEHLPTKHKEAKVSIVASDPKIEINVEKKPIRSKSKSSVAVPARTISSSPHNEIHYEVDEDGLAIIDGDIVLGALNENTPTKGKAAAPDLTLWPEGRVPFFIQGDLENPTRVIKAIAMFANTPIHFVVYQGEEDALVFQNASAGCKSYLGKIGGKQPIWLSSQCGVTEIAHEMMHALGFIHEQNRSDRDSFVEILWNNIIESSKKNFERFPLSLMVVSGSVPFDFQSIMIYPTKMFSRNGLQTLQSIDQNNESILVIFSAKAIGKDWTRPT